MEELIIEAYGKVNLALDVIRKRNDGYHDINTIMQQIDLKDIVTIRDREKGIKIECDNPEVPVDSSNLVYTAWEKMKEKAKIDRGVHIIIEKNIPVASGLAGGSTDAAAVLKGLNKLWKLNFSTKELMDIGVSIGADVPYCIMGGTALAEGIGEKLKILKSFSNKLILLANPGISVSTAHVYNSLRLDKIEKSPDMDMLVQAVENDDIYTLAKNMGNVLEQVTVEEFSQIKTIKEDMIRYGALGSLMSGSGPTVFGLFDDEKKLVKCKEYLEKKVAKVIITKTIE
ncbi:4-(cytidine 5'-diphospho)-2-C-methyl-D-erythritol kinase [Anaerosalibacter bizertensis]|uniref:4-diphosphocytidyl-2-C-methyl-D-erythritol kinase n=1 Tax=Anaerosalibacter bizertensis TaxID=932217 RepID=A0A844FJ26_9FIRM|nr:4-(cytidine 5'-diphospho)-2-C-methyl-D-erythritol kinase [Anaerosalibacter bizertensis]MBU5294300.1 4-(cytidine 5'-diphospho)-2-C-methyl-D-erythritol kinase [Anaerosalibacter bizertensis]MSS43928.1 4-(cytidine 5'-diphospho)-2-C-methyl-D-erythritol kinase [Anaerosalibacter bizertensis]